MRCCRIEWGGDMDAARTLKKGGEGEGGMDAAHARLFEKGAEGRHGCCPCGLQPGPGVEGFVE